MHSKNLGSSCDPEHSGVPRDPEDRSAQSDHQLREKMLDKTLADSFPTSDPPSTIPDPSEADSLSRGNEASVRDIFAGLVPGSWAAVTIDNRYVVATGATREEAERNARDHGYLNVSLVEVPDPEAPLQTSDAA